MPLGIDRTHFLAEKNKRLEKENRVSIASTSKLSMYAIRRDLVKMAHFKNGLVQNGPLYHGTDLKGGPSDLGTTNFTKYKKKSSFYSQSLLILIRKTQVVEIHPTTGEVRELLQTRSTLTGIKVYFYISSSLIYILEIQG